MTDNIEAAGVSEFFHGLAGHLGRRLERHEARLRTTDGVEPEIGDVVRYHGSLERHHGVYEVLGYSGNFVDDLMMVLGKDGVARFTCNPSSCTTAAKD